MGYWPPQTCPRPFWLVAPRRNIFPLTRGNWMVMGIRMRMRMRMRIKKNCEGEGGEEAMGYRLQADRQAFRCLGVSDGGSVLISDLGIRNSKSGRVVRR